VDNKARGAGLDFAIIAINQRELHKRVEHGIVKPQDGKCGQQGKGCCPFNLLLAKDSPRKSGT
jgi:hypothetical protein